MSSEVDSRYLGTVCCSHDDYRVSLATIVDIVTPFQHIEAPPTPASILSSEPFIERPSKLHLTCKIRSLLETKQREFITQLAACLQSIQIWQQLSWRCISCEISCTDCTEDTISLTFVNDDTPSSKRRRKLHRIDEDVPSYDVRIPQDHPAAQLSTVRVHIEVQQAKEEEVMADNKQVPELQHNQPKLKHADTSVQWPFANDPSVDHRQTKQRVDMLDVSSSPLPLPPADDHASPCSSTDMAILASSPPAIPSQAEEADYTHYDELCHTLLAMLLTAVHTGRQRRQARFSYSGGFIELSKIAPSIFMPTFIKQVADRAPFISRIAASLAALDDNADVIDLLDFDDNQDSENPFTNLQSSLWKLTTHHLNTQCAKVRLISSQLQGCAASIDQPVDINDHALIDDYSERGSILSSTDDNLFDDEPTAT